MFILTASGFFPARQFRQTAIAILVDEERLTFNLENLRVAANLRFDLGQSQFAPGDHLVRPSTDSRFAHPRMLFEFASAEMVEVMESGDDAFDFRGYGVFQLRLGETSLLYLLE